MRARWTRLTIRTRLTLVVAAVLIAGFVTTNVLSFRVSTAALRDTILNNELPLTGNNIYSEIQTDLLRPILVSSLMAHDTFVHQWLADGEKDVGAITRYLDKIRETYGVFTSFLISDATHAYYHFSGHARYVDPKNPEDAWFFRAREMTSPYEVNVDDNEEQDKAITIFINYRILDSNGRFLALTGVGLNLRSVERIVSRYGADYRHGIYFVDDSGHIVIRSEGANVVEPNIKTAPGISDVAAEVLTKEEGYFRYVRNGEAMLLTTRHIPDLGWRVLVEQSENDAFRTIWHGFLTNTAIGIAIIGVTILMVSYAINVYQRRLEDLVVTDKLTGIGNRGLFEVEAHTAFGLRERTGQTFSVLLFDIDHFKRINDTFGHLRGDEVIRKVVEAAQSVIRGSNVICRWGGEEFIALLHGCGLAPALEAGERIRAAVAQAALFTPDDGTRVTISVGIAEVADGDSSTSLVSRADDALYRAKQAGRNRVEG